MDSASNEPIPFVNISTQNHNEATSDFDGLYTIEIVNSKSIIYISYAGYKPRKVLPGNKDSIVTYLVQTKKTFVEYPNVISEKPLDTIYFKNSNIQEIKYEKGIVKGFYSRGELHNITTNDYSQYWYKNGQIKYYSSRIFPHSIWVIEWYDNGQVKAKGHLYYNLNDKKKRGDHWYKADDWQYWKKNGTLKN